MPAYFDTGFSVREPMWHGLGTVLDEYPADWDEARRMAGLLWEPTSVPLYQAVGRQATAEGDAPTFAPVPGFQGIARDDTGEVLAVPTDSYQVITHAQMGELLEAVLDTDGAVKFETAGSVRGGRAVWALAYLDEPVTVPGDESPTYPFLAFLNSHDGSGACKVLPTSVRVVCWNTWNAASAEGDRTGNQVVIRHTGNVAERIEEAKAVLQGVRAEAKEWAVMATDLASININDAVVRTFLEEFIPTPENATDQVRNSRAARQATFTKLYQESPTMDGIRGTAYGLVQAAGEYLDHLRPFRTADTYLARTMLRPEPIKAGVIKLVRELATAGA